MKKNLLVSLITAIFGLFSLIASADTTITGAGATFPYPVYTKWADTYQKATGVKLNYQPIGSGGGIKQIQSKVVDFGASDKPLTTKELTESKLLQFPTLVGGVVPIVNIPGLQSGQIKLNGSTLANIYLGKIKKWNDAEIKSLNPGVNLPNQIITVVHRSDGSGTTFLFTNYLSKVSPTWHEQVGNDTAVAWPAGIGGKGNEGVASYVQRVKGSIGYVEFAYAEQNNFAVVQLVNKTGNAIYPSIDAFESAAANAHWKAKNDFSEILTDADGEKSWPITGATYVLVPRVPANPQQALAVLQFFAWAYQATGSQMAKELDYVPLPEAVVKSIKQYWQEGIKDSTGANVWDDHK